MPKRASDTARPDPLRSQLAGLVAQPAPTPPAEKAEPEPKRAAPRASKPPPRSTPKQKKTVSQRTDALIKHQKTMMSQAEVERNAELAGVITSVFGSKVTTSQITRVLWSILSDAEDTIRAEAKRAPKDLEVPSKGDHAGMALYEDAIATFLADALKRS